MKEFPSLEFITWQQFHHLCFVLSKQLELEPSFDTIVSISRGGHVISRILSDFLKLNVLNVTIQSYKDINKRQETKITQKIGLSLKNKHILLIDEIVDTGLTLKKALNYLKRLGPSRVTSTALHVKPRTTIYPDFYATTTEKWVVYPYEVRETIESIRLILTSTKTNKSDFKKLLLNNGFPQEMIKHYL